MSDKDDVQKVRADLEIAIGKTNSDLLRLREEMLNGFENINSHLLKLVETLQR